jgi:hypothetical protein
MYSWNEREKNFVESVVTAPAAPGCISISFKPSFAPTMKTVVESSPAIVHLGAMTETARHSLDTG